MDGKKFLLVLRFNYPLEDDKRKDLWLPKVFKFIAIFLQFYYITETLMGQINTPSWKLLRTCISFWNSTHIIILMHAWNEWCCVLVFRSHLKHNFITSKRVDISLLPSRNWNTFCCALQSFITNCWQQETCEFRRFLPIFSENVCCEWYDFVLSSVRR